MRDELIRIPKFKIGGRGYTKPQFPIPTGNRRAAKENLEPEAHDRRMRGLFKAWDYKFGTHRGEKRMTVRKLRRKRTRLHITVAKEARDIQNIARTHATEAMQRLAEIVNDRGSMDSVAIAAAQVIFDRAYGKAANTNINANVNANEKPSEVTAKQLDERIVEAIKRVEELTGGAPKAVKGKKRPPDVRKPDRDPNSPTQH